MRFTDSSTGRGKHTAPSKPDERIGTAECLALIRHLTAQEDLGSSEEELYGELENELTADLVAEEFTGAVNRVINFEAPESIALLKSFANWSKRRRKGVRFD